MGLKWSNEENKKMSDYVKQFFFQNCAASIDMEE
jgi:hypothetical protein